MNTALLLAIVMLVGSLLAFALLHAYLRKIPHEQSVPRERFRWPVWNWYPIIVAGALAVTLSFAIYHAANDGRTADDLSFEDEFAAERTDWELVSGEEGGRKSATTSTAGTLSSGTAGRPSR